MSANELNGDHVHVVKNTSQALQIDPFYIEMLRIIKPWMEMLFKNVDYINTWHCQYKSCTIGAI